MEQIFSLPSPLFSEPAWLCLIQIKLQPAVFHPRLSHGQALRKPDSSDLMKQMQSWMSSIADSWWFCSLYHLTISPIGLLYSVKFLVLLWFQWDIPVLHLSAVTSIHVNSQIVFSLIEPNSALTYIDATHLKLMGWTNVQNTVYIFKQTPCTSHKI